MEQKFSDVYRTSFLTLDRYLQQTNTAQFYFRPLLPPLNTVTGEFYSLSPAQGTDPSIRINKYSSNGTFLGFGYLYDSSFNVPPGGGGDVSGGYWTLIGSNIYNNNPGFVGIGSKTPMYPLDISGYGTETVIYVTTDTQKAIRVVQMSSNANVPSEIYFDKYEQAGGSVGVDLEAGRGMFLHYNGEDRVSINPTGQVGIGISPQYNLDISGITRIRNDGNRALIVGNTLPPVWTIDDVQIINNGGESASVIVGADGSGALRFLNDNSQTYIQSGLNISNNSGCKMNFTRFGAASQTMTVDTSYQYVYVGANTGNTFTGNKFVVDGSASIQHLELTELISFLDVSNNINPVPTQLVIGSASDRLRIGSSWTGGTGVAGAIQASDFYPDVSGGPFVDHGRQLLLNPLGGNVGINKSYPGAALDVSGSIVSNHHLPHTSYTYDLGSSNAYWRDLYLSSGTIYMGPFSKIRSSNPLTLDLSGNGGLYITNDGTVGRVYDSAFNPAPALAPQMITTILTVDPVTTSATEIPLAMVATKGNYIIKQEWTFGNGSDMSGGNIYTYIITNKGQYDIIIPPFLIPGVGGPVSTTYTTFGEFDANDVGSFTYDTSEIYGETGSLENTSVKISILYLSPSS